MEDTRVLKTPDGSKRKHIVALDGLRGIAVILVMLHHTAPRVFPGGFVGVDLFFTLSGFLISSLLLDEWGRTGAISLSKFYMRRALRLLPAFYTLITAYLLIDLPWQNALIAATYVSNWVRAFHLSDVGLLGHTWSLSIEEQFYICWPLLLIFALKARLSHRRIGILVAALAFFSAGVRLFIHIQDWPSELRVDRAYNGFDTRADSLLLGCLAAVGMHSRVFQKSRTLSLVGMASLCLFILATFSIEWHSPFLYAGGFTLLALAAGAVITAVALEPGSEMFAILRAGPLVWMGKLSYGLYLWHYPVFELSKGWGFPKLMLHPVRFCLTMLIALASYHLIELHFLKAKSRLS